MIKALSIFFATGFYVGFFPWAPGTIGSLVGVLIYMATKSFSHKIQVAIFSLYLILVMFSTIESIKHFKKNDPPQVVCDEITGIWLALLIFDVSLFYLFLAFIFFRFFDILKPFPIKQLEKLPGAYGVMADDIVAGIMTKGVLWIFMQTF